MDEDTANGQEPPQAPSKQSQAFLLTGEVAALLRTPESTVRYWRHVRVGPPSMKLGRRILYRREAVEAWLREREGVAVANGVHHLSAAGAPHEDVQASHGRRRPSS